MTFDTLEIVDKKVASRKNILMLVCSSLFHSGNHKELSLIP